MKNILFACIILIFLIPCAVRGELTRNVNVSWDYDKASAEKVTGFILYLDGIEVCRTNKPAERSMSCSVTLENSPMYFTMTAYGSNKIESKYSEIFILYPDQALTSYQGNGLVSETTSSGATHPIKFPVTSAGSSNYSAGTALISQSSSSGSTFTGNRYVPFKTLMKYTKVSEPVFMTDLLPKFDSEIILDNGGPGTSAFAEWFFSEGVDYYGSPSLSSVSNNKYIYKTHFSGLFDLDFRWTSLSHRCRNVPVEIYDGEILLDTIYVDQMENGGSWNDLGRFYSEDSVSIVILSKNNTCTTNVDAIRIKKIDSSAVIK